jgi:hypothetical protein
VIRTTKRTRKNGPDQPRKRLRHSEPGTGDFGAVRD